jgi:hypothetical protein
VDAAAKTRWRHRRRRHAAHALAALRRILKPSPVNTVRLRRQLAEAVTERGYIFN